MKLFKGWVMAAGLVLSATAANAQVLAPYETGRRPYFAVSDVAGPYAGIPPEAPVARYGPMLLPPTARPMASCDTSSSTTEPSVRAARTRPITFV